MYVSSVKSLLSSLCFLLLSVVAGAQHKHKCVLPICGNQTWSHTLKKESQCSVSYLHCHDTGLLARQGSQWITEWRCTTAGNKIHQCEPVNPWRLLTWTGKLLKRSSSSRTWTDRTSRDTSPAKDRMNCSQKTRSQKWRRRERTWACSKTFLQKRTWTSLLSWTRSKTFLHQEKLPRGRLQLPVLLLRRLQ